VKNIFYNVSTLSYLPQAVTCLKSINDTSKNKELMLFLIDVSSKDRLQIENYLQKFGLHKTKIVLYDDLISDSKIFKCAFNYFSALEICTLAKISAAKYILKKNRENKINIIYCDTDIYFFNEPKLVYPNDETVMVLTPHNIILERNVEEIFERFKMGWLNAGFFFIKSGHRAEKIIDWLEYTVSNFGFDAAEHTLFVDQLSISALPCVFPLETYISGDKRLNVAYWNLSERNIRYSNDCFYVGNKKLSFFHFSGLQLNDFKKITKHAEVDLNPELIRLIKNYQEKWVNSYKYFEEIQNELTTSFICKNQLRERIEKYKIQMGSNSKWVNHFSRTKKLEIFLSSLLKKVRS